MGKLLQLVQKGPPSKEIKIQKPQIKFVSGGSLYGTTAPVFPSVYTGERKTGGAGPLIKYSTDVYALRTRAQQSRRTSEFISGVVDNIVNWVLGSNGLRLKCEPQRGVFTDPEPFNNAMESFWKVYKNSKQCSWDGQKNLIELHREAELESIHGGDTLVVLRIENNLVKIQHIDGNHIMNPPAATSANGIDVFLGNGNRVRQGVELDESGRHIAYHVRNYLNTFVRIEAYDKETGLRIAYLKYGKKIGIDATRGEPEYGTGIETAQRITRINDAALAGEEGRQSVVYSIETVNGGDVTDPGAKLRVQGQSGWFDQQGNLTVEVPNDNLGKDINGISLNKEMSSLTNGQVWNLNEGQKMNMHSNEMTQNLPEFTDVQYELLCILETIPLSVAKNNFSKGSFSSNRLEGKVWERTFLAKRKASADGYLDPIFTLQAYILVMTGEINAPGLMQAFNKQDWITAESYLYHEFEGDMFPDIDEYKTIMGVRAALGTALTNMPLIDGETAISRIGGRVGFASLMAQLEKEMDMMADIGIDREDKLTANGPEMDEASDETTENGNLKQPKPAKKPAKAKK